MIATSSQPGPAMVTICVTNLASDTTAAEVAELFAAYGDVRGIRLSQDKYQRRFQTIGYVDLLPDEAARALAGLEGHLFKGATIRLTQSLGPASGGEDTADQAADIRKDRVVPSNSLRPTFGLISVEKVTMPASAGGDDWFRYVLQSGTSSIVGYRQGPLHEVTAFAQGCADDFNVRNTIGWKTTSCRVRKQ